MKFWTNCSLLTNCAGAKVSAIVDAISALRAKLGGGAESPIVTKSGRAGIVRFCPTLTTGSAALPCLPCFDYVACKQVYAVVLNDTCLPPSLPCLIFPP